MVAGHLQEKNGIYYVVLTYKTYDGKRKTKWQSTGLPTKGNKRRAEAMMRELQDDFEPPVDPNGPPSKAMLFADYLVQWLEIAKSTVKLTTYLCACANKIHAFLLCSVCSRSLKISTYSQYRTSKYRL